MVKVFWHTKDDSGAEWENEELTFSRIPAIGEYVAVSSDSCYYKVCLVVHCPFDDSEYEAEVYAVLEDEAEQTDIVGRAGEQARASEEDAKGFVL